jgi:hypothetical protein
MQDLAPPIAVKAHNLSIGELMASHAPIASVTPSNPPAMAMVASTKVKARGKKKRFKALGTAFLAAVEACAQNDGASK